MEKNEHRLCPALWFSGFFGLGALVHLIRLLFQVPVTLGGWQVPLRLSAVLVLAFGGLSAVLLYIAGRRPCCSSKSREKLASEHPARGL